MELPTYRLPTLKSILIHIWEKTWMYLKKAGTTILAVTIIVCACFAFPMNDYGRTQASVSAQKKAAAGRIRILSSELLQFLEIGIMLWLNKWE